MYKYKVGDKVKVVDFPSGYDVDDDSMSIGDIGKIIYVDTSDCDVLVYKVSSDAWSDWWFSEDDLESYLNSKDDVVAEIAKVKQELKALETLLKTFD